MNKIEKLIEELCPEGVEFEYLGNTCEIKTGKGITKNDSSDTSIYPIISGGKDPMGYYDKYNRLENTVTISRVGANSGYVSFINIKFYLNDKCFSIIPIEEYKHRIISKFLFYILKTNESSITALQSEGGVPTINTTKVSKLSIPIPPLNIQEEIVTILDKFTSLEAELEAELEARKRQYNYYLNDLLSFNEDKVEWKTLGEIGEFIRGNGLQKKDFTETGVGCIHYGQIYTYYGIYTDKTKSFVSPELAKKLKKVRKNDLIITNTSENLEDVCKAVVWLGDEEIVTGGHATIFRHSQNPKYIAYYTQTQLFSIEKKKYATGTKVIDVSAKNLEKLKIPIPSPQEQERIVSILDKFDKLVNDISEGLPAEISARRKQYEYYREKLLNFKQYERHE